MIHRVTGQGRPELEIQLWHALGEIYRTRLRKFNEAAEAFSAAAKLEPDNVERHVILAELFTATGRSEDAIKRHLELLRLDPTRVGSLKTIREYYSASEQYDKAFAIVSLLATHKQATQAELEFFEQWLPQPMVAATAPLADDDWLVHLRAEEEDPYVSEIFNTILSFAVSLGVRPTKEFGLGPGTAVDLDQQGGGLLAQQLVTAGRTLGVVIPKLHVVRDQPAALAYALTDPPTTIMGGVLTQLGDRERVFLMGRHLAYYQGGRYLAIACPSKSELVGILAASTAVVTGREDALPKTAKPFHNRLKAWLRKNPHLAERLTGVVKRFLERGGKVDIDGWLRGVELTAGRAGLLLVADPRVALSALSIDSSGPANIPPKARFDDLTRFVVSDGYRALRQTMGIEVG
jgi:hypothetical protein